MVADKMIQFFKRLNIFDSEHRSLTAVYIFSLSSIAVMAIVFQSFKFTIYSGQLDTVETVRILERQSALVEQTQVWVVDAQITSDPNKLSRILDRLRESVRRIDENHRQAFRQISEDFCQTLECLRYIDKQKILKSTAALNIENLSNIHFEEFLEDYQKYQNFLNRSAIKLDTRIKQTTQRLINLDISFLILLLILLIIQAVLGFRPAVQKLNEALSVRSDFISRISHEIRNPMNSIMGMTDILKSTRLSAEQSQYVQNLQRSSAVLLDMLNNLVDFSGLETRTINLKDSQFNPNHLIDKVTDVISIQAHDKGLELFTSVDPKIPLSLIGDGGRLEQVLLNLLNNALKFTSRGYIHLKVTLDSATVDKICLNFSVKDTGIGIHEDKIESIFRSFVQEDSSIKRRFGGSGLGLSICKEIVELMGGRIQVKTAKDKGAEFSFSLDFKVDPNAKDNNLSSLLQDRNIILVSGLEDTQPIEFGLKLLSPNISVIKSVVDLEGALKRDRQNLLVVDDSLGIISMINVHTVAQEILGTGSIYSLMRSNFSVENMELLRRNGYKNFIIKPFRYWHVLGHQPINRGVHGDFEEAEHFENMKQKIKEHKLSVLAVDDSNDNLFLLREILSPITHDIDFAANGREACEMVAKKDYDFIFMDIQMPIMDGYTAIRKIRATQKDLPVFAVTAHAGLVEEKKCIESGFTGRLVKPIDRKKVYGTISEVFNISLPGPETGADDKQAQMLKRLLPKYFETRDEDMKVVKKAMAANDFKTIKKIGHRIKGSAKSFGFAEIGELSDRLEAAAERENREECRHLIETIDSDLGKAQNDFHSDLI